MTCPNSMPLVNYAYDQLSFTSIRVCDISSDTSRDLCKLQPGLIWCSSRYTLGTDLAIVLHVELYLEDGQCMFALCYSI